MMNEDSKPIYQITEDELIQYALLYAEANSADTDSIGKVHTRAKEFENKIKSRGQVRSNYSTVVEDITFEGAAIVQAARRESMEKERVRVLGVVEPFVDVETMSIILETLKNGEKR